MDLQREIKKHRYLRTLLSLGFMTLALVHFWAPEHEGLYGAALSLAAVWEPGA